MSRPLVSVAIPTYNRARYIPLAIRSVIEQTEGDLELLVVDNASTDDTEEIVRSIADKRISLHKAANHVDILGNWNRALQMARGEYLVILGDDDCLKRDFLEKSIDVNSKHPTVALSFSHCNKVSESGDFISLWGYDFLPAGFCGGADYLFWTLEYEACLTNSSTVLLRRDSILKYGDFEARLARNIFDFDMWIRIATDHDVYFIDEVLCDYRIHDGQVSQLHWRDKPTGKVGTYLALFEIVSILMAKGYPFESGYLPSKLNWLTKRISEYLMLMDHDL